MSAWVAYLFKMSIRLTWVYISTSKNSKLTWEFHCISGRLLLSWIAESSALVTIISFLHQASPDMKFRSSHNFHSLPYNNCECGQFTEMGVGGYEWEAQRDFYCSSIHSFERHLQTPGDSNMSISVILFHHLSVLFFFNCSFLMLLQNTDSSTFGGKQLNCSLSLLSDLCLQLSIFTSNSSWDIWPIKGHSFLKIVLFKAHYTFLLILSLNKYFSGCDVIGPVLGMVSIEFKMLRSLSGRT